MGPGWDVTGGARTRPGSLPGQDPQAQRQHTAATRTSDTLDTEKEVREEPRQRTLIRRCSEEDWDLTGTLPAGARTPKKKRLLSPLPWGKLGPALAGSAGTKLPTLFTYVLMPSPASRPLWQVFRGLLLPTFPLRSHTFSLFRRVKVGCCLLLVLLDTQLSCVTPHSPRSGLPSLPFSTVLPALFPVLPLLSPRPSVLLHSSRGL